MSTETVIILGGIGVAVLAVLILRLGKRLAIGLLILGGLAVVGTVALSMLTQASATRETAIAAQRAAEAAQTAAAGQAMTGAATSITLFLVILLLVVVLAIAGVAFAWTWWQKRQRREQYVDMLRQAQLYAALQGQRLPGPARRPIYPAMHSLPGYPAQAAPPSVIVVGQQPAAYAPYPYAYPPAALGQVEGDPYADFLPPPDGEWEVLD
jgi:flagellar basal body-associated protein FliL